MDGGVARTAGEAWTCNGAVLTIRTDSRFHSDAPVSGTGSIGATTISATLGGGILIDSTNVRWMPYNTGSGTVPAIGTSITQGGVSGYLLGVWASYTVAPTAVGDAMPASGYLKFREVTGGSFTTGALGGISASATAADRQGWIEIVQDQAVANTVPRLGYFRTRGGWFELDQVTSGSANDVIQIPTNGGGANTLVPAIWIETAVGSGVYECYPGIQSTWFNNTNLGTDIRSKFVDSIGNGQVRIGYDGTNNVGYVPPAGCKIRIPSNIGRQAISATRFLNSAPHATLSSRPDFTTTSAGVIDIEYFMNDWYMFFASPYQVIVKHCATFDIYQSSNEASPMLIQDLHTGAFNGSSISLTISACSLGGTISDCKFYRANAASNGDAAQILYTSDLTVNNVEAGVIQYARSTGQAFDLLQNFNLTFNNCKCVNGTFRIVTCFGTRVNNLDYTDRFIDVTNATTGLYGVNVGASSDDTIVDGLTFGFGGAISNVNSYLAPFLCALSFNTVFRNAGTRAAPLSCQAGFAPQYAVHDAGGNVNLKFQRVYLEATRTSAYISVNTSSNVSYENIYGTVGSLQMLSNDATIRGVRAASNSVSGGASVYGTHWHDMFISDTEGRIWLTMNEPTTASGSQYSSTLGTGAGFTSGGQISMPNLNDQIIFTTPHYILGHTGFQNVAATLTGTGTANFSYEYDIDVNDGTGFTGTYQTLNGANLSAETVNPALGFKLRFRITCTNAASTNAITCVRITTNSTAIAQDNLYPLDTASPTLTLSGLDTGTTVAVYDSGFSEELDREILAGSTYEYDYQWNSDDGNAPVNILIWKEDRNPFLVATTLTNENLAIPLSQSDDLVYNTGYTNTHTIDFPNSLIILDSAEYSVPEVYSLWKNEMSTGLNPGYTFAFTQVGGNELGGGNFIPYYTFLSSEWKIRPREVNGTTDVVSGILLSEDGSDPFVDTLGAYTVRINYQQPVQAISISTSGGGGSTPAEIWNYSNRELTDIIDSPGITTLLTRIADAISTRTESISDRDIILSQFDSGVDEIVVGIGAIDCGGCDEPTLLTIAIRSGGSPLPDVSCWVSSDTGGSVIVEGPYLTNSSGQVTFTLDTGTFYLWRILSGFAFTNPKTVEWSGGSWSIT